MNITSKKLIFLLLPFSFSSHASIGEYISYKNAPEQTCFLEFESNKGDTPFTCTGNVVSNKMIKTAAHCTEAGRLTSISCANSQTAEFESLTISPPDFDLKTIGHDLNNRRNDFSLIPLKKDLAITPMEMITSLTELKNVLNSKGDCALFSYGLNEKHRSEMGYLSATKFRKKYLTREEDYLIYKAPFMAQVMIGDSGGALYCEYNDKWVDIGTVSGHTWEGESIFSLNSYMSSFIQKNLDKTQKRFVNKKFRMEMSKVATEELDNNQSNTIITIDSHLTLKPFSIIKIDGMNHYNVDNAYVRVTVNSISAQEVNVNLELDGYSSFYLCDDKILCESSYENVIVQKKDLINSKLVRSFPKYNFFN